MIRPALLRRRVSKGMRRRRRVTERFGTFDAPMQTITIHRIPKRRR
jgi:hypothetical protein